MLWPPWTTTTAGLLLPLLLVPPIMVTLARRPYFLQDLLFFLRLVLAGLRILRAERRHPPPTMLEVFGRRARETPRKVLLLFRDESYSYEQVERRSNQVARALRERAGVRQGDCVAVFLGNEPAYLWLWLGCAKVGCVMACLNCNIRARSLAHCFQLSGAKVLLADPVVPLSFILAYQYDMAYGSLLQRMKGEAENILDTEHPVLEMPKGPLTFDSIEKARRAQSRFFIEK